MRSAAWTVPVVAAAAAAPAFAASCGSTAYDWRLNWSGSSTSFSRSTIGATHTASAVITGAIGTSPITVSFSSAMFGSMQRDDDNFRISNALTQTGDVTNVGGLGQGPGLNISHQSPIPTGRGNRQEVSISFNRAISNLAFVITDLDRTNDWSDRVELSGTRAFDGPNIDGSGVNGDPWRPDDNGNVDNDDGYGNQSVTYTGAIAANTPIVLTFWNNSGNGNQRIFLSDFTFSAMGC